MSKTGVLGILLILVIIITLSYIFMSDKKNETEKEAINYVSKVILEGKEFSSLALHAGMIYAGGAQGLYCINPDDFTYYEVKKNEKSYISVRALLKDAENLWVGHEEGIDIFKSISLEKSISSADGLTDTRIHDILRVDKETVYASTFSGVAVINENTIEYITMKDFLPGDIIKAMLMDDYGGIWFGSYVSKGGGVVCITSGSIESFDIASGLAHDAITTIAKDEQGKVYVGSGVFSRGGANIFEKINGKWSITATLLKEDGLAGDKVRFIFPDTNRIWYCSEFDGIAIFNEDEDILYITTDNGLSDNEVKRIISDDHGDYWLATNRGITYIKKEKLFGGGKD